jgi:hypothetical protein
MTKPRYYMHGDQHEETGLYFCIGCDFSYPEDHFRTCDMKKHLTPKALRLFEDGNWFNANALRHAESFKVWKRMSPQMHAKYRVVYPDPKNLFA